LWKSKNRIDVSKKKIRKIQQLEEQNFWIQRNQINGNNKNLLLQETKKKCLCPKFEQWFFVKGIIKVLTMYGLRCQILKAFIVLANATFDAPY